VPAPLLAAASDAGKSDPAETAVSGISASAAPADPSAAAAPAAPQLAPAAAPLAPAPTPAAAAPAPAPATPAAPQAPLSEQIGRPILDLRGAAHGEHIVTVRVTPDNLGPVTVRAHVSGDGIRVELFAPTDQARDALKAILPDLRRDLAQSGPGSSLGIAAGDAGTSGGGAAGAGRDRREEAPARPFAERMDPRPAPPPARTLPVSDRQSLLDVLA
jgi:flagellar hook-length control protein FliK